MKKWLDDLYAILLKRGLPTLDNSLKNYDKNNSFIDEYTSYKKTALLPGNGAYQIDLKENINNLDFYDMYITNSDVYARYVKATIMCFTENKNITVVDKSENYITISASTTNSIITITNNGGYDLNIVIFIKKVS